MNAAEEDASASIKVVTSIFFLAWITSFVADMLMLEIVSNFFGTDADQVYYDEWSFPRSSRLVIGGGGGGDFNSYVCT